MKRMIAVAAPFLMMAVMACPADKPEAKPVATVPDTAVDLSKVATSLPPAAPDTFKPVKLTPSGGGAARSSLPEAPPPLMEAVQRESGFSRFCFTEFGAKNDPSLHGNVVVAVTVGAGGVTDARVADANWSSSSGKAVSQCINDKASRAWKLSQGSVKPGKYAVRLSFSGN